MKKDMQTLILKKAWMVILILDFSAKKLPVTKKDITKDKMTD